jgi:ABC-type transport system involved in cytochrome bd biosynthesis fused ATPase/permease subunit
MTAPLSAPKSQWRLLAQTLDQVSLAKIVAYVLLSLGSALTGSLAAVLLVPLVQPGHALPIVSRLFHVQANVYMYAAVFAAVTAAFAILRWATTRLAASLSSSYSLTLRQRVHARLIDAPLTSLADATSAEIANVLTYNVEVITQGFNALLLLLAAGFTCLISICFALWFSPTLVLAAPVLAVFGLIAARISSREQSLVGRQYVSDLTRLFWHSEDFPRRLRHVRSFQREASEKASYGAISAQLAQGYRHQLNIIASGRLMLELLAAIGVASLFILAYRLHGVDQSSLIAVCLLLGRLLPYLVSTRQSFQQLHVAAPAFELWQKYVHLDPEHASAPVVDEKHDNDTLFVERMRITPPSMGIEIRHFPLVPGELTLICGDSGIGKSSLIDVLAGMMKPQAFAASVNGRSLDFSEYRARVRKGAYVSQSVRPWQNSIRDSLLWAAPDATDEMLCSALNDVGLEKRLSESRDKLDTALNDSSSRLSGGELQRLLLAQVILRRPYLALLDEATSALDVKSELDVLSALKRRLPQTIIVVVSHRNGIASMADQCLTIDENREARIVRKDDSKRSAFQN